MIPLPVIESRSASNADINARCGNTDLVTTLLVITGIRFPEAGNGI